MQPPGVHSLMTVSSNARDQSSMHLGSVPNNRHLDTRLETTREHAQRTSECLLDLVLYRRCGAACILNSMVCVASAHTCFSMQCHGPFFAACATQKHVEWKQVGNWNEMHACASECWICRTSAASWAGLHESRAMTQMACTTSARDPWVIAEQIRGGWRGIRHISPWKFETFTLLTDIRLPFNAPISKKNPSWTLWKTWLYLNAAVTSRKHKL